MTNQLSCGRTVRFLGVIVSIGFMLSCVGVKSIPGISLSKPKELDEKTIIAGLREALEIGTRNAVKVVSKKNGYLSNRKIAIPLPDELEEVADKLRSIGLRKDVDRFIEDMNHAAEKAAEGAADIFIDAIRKMTLDDARRILKGPDDAATSYFEKHTRKRLYDMFFPVIRDAMNRLGVTKLYKFLLDSYNKLPLVRKKTYDLDRYITNKGLDGLFTMLSEEEKKIRKDPAARVTELLRKVFG